MRLENALRQKGSERDKVVGLFRRGRIETPALDRQLDDILKEETTLRTQIEAITSKLRGVEAGDQHLASAAGLLQKLRQRLEEPISWEVKRQGID
jgi:hypothetical protein